MESNNETTSLLKNLLERLDSVECEVKTLKENEARRCAGSSASEAETSGKRDGDSDNASSEAPEGNLNTADKRHQRSRTRHSRSKRSDTRHRSRSSDDKSSRSRLRSPSQRQKSRKGKSPARHRSWADHMSASEDEAIDYSKEVIFNNSETEDQSCAKVVEVSERTAKFLQEKCTRRVPNTERRSIRDEFPLPKVPATRLAQLDRMMKSEASPGTKTSDKQLARVQTLLLDSLVPLTSLLEAHRRGDMLDPKEVVQAVKSGILLIGNALPVVGDDTTFKEAAPLLFSMEFARKSKEMVEQVKAMRSTITRKPDQKPVFFQGGPPHKSGGLQPTFRKGRSPNLPPQGEAIPGGRRPILHTEKN